MPRQSKPCNRGLVGLIGQQEKKLNNLYNSTAREISVILTKYKLKSKRDVWLGNANAQKEVDAAMNRFQSKLLGSIKGDMGSSWGMADDCADGVVNDYLKNINIPDDVRNAMLYQNASAFDAFVNRRRNGLNLSDRVWKITKDTKKQFEQLLGSGIMDGRSAQGMATDLRRYLKEPNKQFRRVRNEFGKLVLSNPAKDYHPGQGVYRSSYQNALRLARNEVNLSYRHNEHLRRQNMPFVTGIRVNLSGSHPTRDICDDMQGDYPKTFRFGGWHPTCICFTTSILLDKKEFVEYAKTGKIDASRNITKIPDNASKYLKENADTFANYKNPPYFLKDNFDFKNGDYTFHNRNQIILDAKNAGIDTEKVFMRDGVYTPERQILHDDIIQKFMSESNVRGTKQKYMLGGAPANGKSALVDSGFLPHPKGILTVDSDAIKGLIPEYQTMLANGDSAAAAFVHEESSYLAKRILAQAEKLGDDFVLDGVNDGSIEKLLKKIEGYKKGGSKIRADYVSLDTKLSKDLAKARYEKTGRYVPDDIVAGNNIEVSKLVPEILKRNAIDEFYLWDTNIKDKARLILKQIDGELTMYDEKLYKRFLRKAGKEHAEKVFAEYALSKSQKEAAEKLSKAAINKAAKSSAKKLEQEAIKKAAQKEAKEIEYKAAKTIEEARKNEEKFIKTLTELEKQVVGEYTTDSYIEYNEFLRRNRGWTDLYENEVLKDHVNTLRAVIDKAPKVEAKTFRAISFNTPEEVENFIKTLRQSEFYTDKGFQSSSFNKVDRFLGENFIQFEIKGESGMYINKLSRGGNFGDDIAAALADNEVLFNPGTKFKIKSIKSYYDEPGRFIVELEEYQKAATAYEEAQLKSLMKKAADSADEVQKLAEQIAKDFKGYATPINLKSRDSILRKVRDEYKGIFADVKDAVRTTVIVDEKKIDEILKLLEKNTKFTKIKRQLPADFQGYSGSITNLKTSQNIISEIQINTERMIYAKEKPADAQRIMGLKRWNEIKRESGLPGGLGHTYYDEFRKLNALPRKTPIEKARLKELEKLSVEYYKHFI